ncbi:MAG TPA: histidine phosphatase family protein [Solirubrobacterales bacterium]|nr:histidine phosphatase family protein [Solirubrobacterales bacterium]
MRALFLRHGESAHNAHTGSEALADDEGDRLTERGQAQARAAAAALGEHGVTRLLSSPQRRARETAAELEAALGLGVETLSYTHELAAGESFEQLVARVRRLKEELEAGGPDGRPLLVGHGIFTRFFLLDSVLGDAFEPPMAGRIWQLGSHNCGLSTFAHGEYRDPSRSLVPGWVCLSWMERPWDPP